MTIGQLVDYIEEYNRMHDTGDENGSGKASDKPKVRKATQADWDALAG